MMRFDSIQSSQKIGNRAKTRLQSCELRRRPTDLLDIMQETTRSISFSMPQKIQLQQLKSVEYEVLVVARS